MCLIDLVDQFVGIVGKHPCRSHKQRLPIGDRTLQSAAGSSTGIFYGTDCQIHRILGCAQQSFLHATLIAADLHDHVGHSLALVRMQLESIPETKPELEKNILVKDVSNKLKRIEHPTSTLNFQRRIKNNDSHKPSQKLDVAYLAQKEELIKTLNRSDVLW